jgi:hypothetical protein
VSRTTNQKAQPPRRVRSTELCTHHASLAAPLGCSIFKGERSGSMRRVCEGNEMWEIELRVAAGFGLCNGVGGVVLSFDKSSAPASYFRNTTFKSINSDQI